MERRKLLLGSGAALATVLAGCSGSDTDDEDPDEEPEDTEDETEPDDDESDQEAEEEPDERADVPGFDSEAFSFDSDAIAVDRIEYEDESDDDDNGGNETDDGNETDAEGGDSPQGIVHVHATAEVDDRDELYAELESLAADVEAPVDDINQLKESIQRIELSFVDPDEEELDTLSIMPLWVYEYMEEQLTDEQFLQQVLSTSEQTGN